MFLLGLGIVTFLFPTFHLLGSKLSVRIQDRIQACWYGALLKILAVRVQIAGRPMTEAGLWVSNHVSWLDIVVLGAQSPVSFVAKSEVAAWPVVGYLGRRVGTLFVRRGDGVSTRETAEQMAWRLRQGRAVALFPEGTSTRGDRVLRFHARLFRPAALAGVKVQPVAIAYGGEARELAPFVGEDEFLPHLLDLLAVRDIRVALTFGNPLSANSIGIDRLAQTSRTQIVASLLDESSTGPRALEG